MAEVTAADVARRIDVPPATLRRWIRSGLVPLANGTWSDAAIAQALAQIADAEVKLFHLYVHEPLMRDGFSGLEMAEEMETVAALLLPMMEAAGSHLRFGQIGEVTLKGFNEPTELFVAGRADASS
jgi:hypothetical protein